MKYMIPVLAMGLVSLVTGGVLIEDLRSDVGWRGDKNQKETERTVEEREQQSYHDAIAKNCVAIKDPRFKPAICPDQ